jgi:two-component system, sensor histidine kinase PdtaS
MYDPLVEAGGTGPMSVSSLPVGKFEFPWRVRKGAILRARGNAELTAALEASLARERASQQANAVLLQSQRTLALEFDHRFLNGLQWITTLLTLQSRGAAPEAAEQLAIAARRVAALGSVHRQLHLLDNQRTAELGQFLRRLCDDLSDLLFQDGENDRTISVESTTVEMEAATAIPLGFIVTELVTNAAKHARSNIIVRIGGALAASYSLSVIDDGPGLPPGFDPVRSKGLGMTIVLALVEQIRGTLKILPGDDGRGTKFTVYF